VIDRVFEGDSVAAAVDAAARALGLASERVRYVVLAREAGGRLGLAGTKARIAVLAQSAGTPLPAPTQRLPEQPAPIGAETPDQEEPRVEDIRRMFEALGAAVGKPLVLDLDDELEPVILRLDGPACDALFDEDGEALRAVEHVVGRILAADGIASARIECATYRTRREAWLRARTLELGRQVLADGETRELEPLNAYERRIVHTAATELPGVRSVSVGERSERRVTLFAAGRVVAPEQA